MRRLRLFFIFVMSWAFISSLLMACSKDKPPGQPIQSCPPNFSSNNGICVPVGPYNNTNPYQNAFIPNGSIQNSSNFRDFHYRILGYQYYCGYAAYVNCNDAQIKLQKINEENYRIIITSPSIGTRTVALNGRKFTYNDRPGFYLQVYYGNPVAYIIAELDVADNLDQESVPYYFNYKRNANDTSPRPIVTGIMKKGIDY